ncbi:TrkH family potassium uptake protein [Alkaliphilus crotonatoxidans]
MDKLEKIRLEPTQVLVMGFGAIILMGAILLNLPIANVTGRSIGFVDALFTATSAVCVTGLAVVDTGTFWSPFGKTIILLLIQVGGLGFMTMATMVALFLGKKISLKERLVIQEALNQNSLAGLVRFTRYIVFGTFAIEGLGAFFLSFRFVPQFGFLKGIAYSIFHSISAFCNAGFDIIGNGVSLMPYVKDPIVNFTVMLLIIVGGLGFSVLVDIILRRSFKKISLHSKITLLSTGILILFGFLFFLLLEWSNPQTLGSLGFGGKLLAALFQSVTPRTAGFNTLNISQLTDASKLMTMIFMFIGGSPASTAGGIKTVTLGVLILTVISVIRGREDTEAFGKRIPRSIVNRSLTIGVVGILIVFGATMVLTVTERAFSFVEVLFEAVSAIGTVGLSMGITPDLSIVGKLLIIVIMFFGRLGPLTVAFALARQQRKNKGTVKYPEEKVMVG